MPTPPGPLSQAEISAIRIRRALALSKHQPPKFCPQVPTERQQLFLDQRKEKEVFYGGAAGGGKSSALLMAALEDVHVKNYSALLLRRTYADLAKPGALLDRAAGWLRNTPAKWNEQRKQWTFPSGAKISFGYLETENDKYNYQSCFHPDTEILTLAGWKQVADVTTDDVAASLNPETRELEYQPVEKAWAYDFDGELITLNQRFGVAFAVTPNHSIWATTNRRRDVLQKYDADKLPATARIPQWCRWTGESPPTEFQFTSDGNNGRTIVFSSSDWLEFLGWYLSEGCTDTSRWAISITQLKEEGRSQIRTLLERVGLNFHESPHGFSFNNKALVLYLKQFGLSGQKFIPQEIKQYDRDSLLTLLHALMAGDGTWYQGRRQGIYVTTSKRLADDISEVAFKCGYRATLGFVDGNAEGSPFGQGRRWRVGILHRNEQDTWVTSCVDGVNYGIKRQSYNGKVYCVTVPPHHTVLIRYAGRMSWSGQSEYQFIGFDELSQFSQSQYLYLFSRLRRLTNSSVPLRMRAGSNPGGVGGRWVQERFIPNGFTPDDAQETKAWVKTGRDEVGRDYRRIFVPARMHDNPHLDQVEYLESLNELDLVTREQLLKGDWQVRERGNILPMWTDDHAHVITWDEFADVFKTKHIPMNWLLGVYQDWGTTLEHPCVTSWFATAPASAPVVNGVSMAGAVFLYRGLTVSDKTVREVAGIVNEAMRPYGEKPRIQKWQMSHEASSERIAYQREHALSFQSWPTGKTRGIAQLRNALELVETDKPHPFKPRVMGHPRLYHIIDDPSQLIYAVDDNGLSRHRSEIAAYRWATLKSGDPTVTVVPHALFNDAVDTERAAAADYWPLSAHKTQAEIDEEKLRPELQMPAILNEINPLILQAKIQSRDLYLKRLDAENKKCQHKALAPTRIRFRR